MGSCVSQVGTGVPVGEECGYATAVVADVCIVGGVQNAEMGFAVLRHILKATARFVCGGEVGLELVGGIYGVAVRYVGL